MQMTFILKAREFIGKKINPISLFFLKIKTKSIIKNFINSREEIIRDFKINYNKDNIRIFLKVYFDSSYYSIVTTFYFLDGDETVNIIKDKVSMYNIIFDEAIKMIDFKKKTIKEVTEKCNVESEDIKIVEFIWENDIIMRSRFKIKKFDSEYSVAVSSDGLEFYRFYDIYDYLDQPPIFFFREKHKESFLRNIKELTEKNLN